MLDPSHKEKQEAERQIKFWTERLEELRNAESTLRPFFNHVRKAVTACRTQFVTPTKITMDTRLHGRIARLHDNPLVRIWGMSVMPPTRDLYGCYILSDDTGRGVCFGFDVAQIGGTPLFTTDD